MKENKATEAKKETYNAGHASPSKMRRVSKTYSLRQNVAEGVSKAASELDISASAWADKVFAEKLGL